MKELKINLGGLWSCITAIAITLLLCGTTVFVVMQHNQTQKDIAEIQAKADIATASKNAEGLSDIGRGICKTSDKQFTLCN